MFAATASSVIGATHRHDVILVQNLVLVLFWNAKQEKQKGAAAGVRWRSDVDLIWFFFSQKSRHNSIENVLHEKSKSKKKYSKEKKKNSDNAIVQ